MTDETKCREVQGLVHATRWECQGLGWPLFPFCVIFHRDFGKTWHVVFIVVSSWSVAVVLFPERYFEFAHSGNSALCATRSFLGRHLAQITAAPEALPAVSYLPFHAENTQPPCFL